MIIQIADTVVKDWKLQRTNIELRIRPNKDFVPKDLDVIQTPKNYTSVSISFAQVTDPNLNRTFWQATIPDVYLYTTTDADVGRNIRYVAEYWDTKKNQKVGNFTVTNFLLSPEMGAITFWDTVDAFSRGYKRDNDNILKNSNIDLSDYSTTAQVNELIENAIEDGDFATKTELNNFISVVDDTIYTKTEIDTNFYNKTQVDALFASVSGAVTISGVNTIVNNALTNYYTKAEINGFINTINNTFANYYTVSQVYTKTEVNNLISAIDVGDALTTVEVNALIADYFDTNPPPAGDTSTVEIEVVTSSLANGAEEALLVNLGKTYILHKIESAGLGKPCRVRGYRSVAFRSTDQSRPEADCPTGEHGLIFEEKIGASNLSVDQSPLPIGSSAESPRVSTTPLLVRNDGTTGVVTLKFLITKLES